MLKNLSRSLSSILSEPIRVLVTAGSGEIAYNLLFRIASGNVFGEHQPVILQVLDNIMQQGILRGVVMELNDSAFPLLHGVIASDTPSAVFAEADYAFLIGSKPQGPYMDREDHLRENGENFKKIGQYLDRYSKKSVKVVTIGDPANTNCLVAMMNAPHIPKENFTAMLRLDHNRALCQLAAHMRVKLNELNHFFIWGNHSPSMYPDVSHIIVGQERHMTHGCVDSGWVEKEMKVVLQERSSSVNHARKNVSMASAASAAVDHMRDWVFGNHRWVSLGMHSEIFHGEYQVPPGIVFSGPAVCTHKTYTLVKGLWCSDITKRKIQQNVEELLEERETVIQFIKH